MPIYQGASEWLKDLGGGKWSPGGHLTGPKVSKFFQGGPYVCPARKVLKNCVKEFVSWVILRGLFPLITHKKFMKFTTVLVKISGMGWDSWLIYLA